jgi:hypothetical protein
MKLACDEKGMLRAGQFDHLDELPVRGHAAKNKTFTLEHLAELGIEFVAVAMSLSDRLSPVIDIAG